MAFVLVVDIVVGGCCWCCLFDFIFMFGIENDDAIFALKMKCSCFFFLLSFFVLHREFSLSHLLFPLFHIYRFISFQPNKMAIKFVSPRKHKWRKTPKTNNEYIFRGFNARIISFIQCVFYHILFD